MVESKDPAPFTPARMQKGISTITKLTNRISGPIDYDARSVPPKPSRALMIFSDHRPTSSSRNVRSPD